MADELDLPLSVISRIVKQALPDDTIVGKESVSMFADAASVFILYLTDTANMVAKKCNRKTISAPDVLEAIKEVNYDMFLTDLNEKLDEYRASLKKNVTETEKEEAGENESKADEDTTENETKADDMQ